MKLPSEHMNEEKEPINSNCYSGKVNRTFVLILILYLVSSLYLLRYYRYNIYPDSISYISIAQKYLHGDFHNAINGGWPPLISWLHLPLLFGGLEPLLSFELLNSVMGLMSIIGIRLLSFQFEMTERIRNIIFFTLIPISLSFHFSQPDFLVTCTLVYYFCIIFRTDYTKRRYDGALCGLIGGLSYLSKHYAQPFFFFHFILFNVFHYLKKKSKVEKRKVLHHLAYGLIVFTGINAIWIGMISYKYNEITLGTSARGTHAYFGPDVPDSSDTHPRGFIKPPNETAVSIWEDDYHTIINHYWNPFASWRNFKHQLKLILKSLQESYRVTLRFSPLSATIIIFYILYFVQKKSTIFKKEFFNPLVTLALYSSGYILIGSVVDRYLWIDYVLLLLMGGYVINLLFRSSFFSNARKTILLLFFSLSFVANPMIYLIQSLDEGKDIYLLSQVLTNEHKIKGNIASNAQWHKSLYISYHLKSQYYGQKRKYISDDNLKTELHENDIDYYFVWRNSSDSFQALPKFLLDHRKIFDDRIPDLTVYNLKEIR